MWITLAILVLIQIRKVHFIKTDPKLDWLWIIKYLGKILGHLYSLLHSSFRKKKKNYTDHLPESYHEYFNFIPIPNKSKIQWIMYEQPISIIYVYEYERRELNTMFLWCNEWNTYLTRNEHNDTVYNATQYATTISTARTSRRTVPGYVWQIN